jgi:hypothetical protein
MYWFYGGKEQGTVQPGAGCCSAALTTIFKIHVSDLGESSSPEVAAGPSCDVFFFVTTLQGSMYVWWLKGAIGVVAVVVVLAGLSLVVETVDKFRGCSESRGFTMDRR